MKIASPLFGELDVPDERIIEFPLGLPGFEQCKRFTALHDADQQQQVFQLQSLDDPEVVFSITAPECLGVNYEFELTDEELVLLEKPSAEQVSVAVIVRREEDQADPAATGLRANFMAPIVLNVAARRGLQKVIGRLGCDITLRAQG